MDRLPFSLLLVLLISGTAPAANAQSEPIRAMWMSRFEYSTSSPADVQQRVANAANMGITDLIFQVRGKADAYYNSSFEPRAERLNGNWDPLQTAVDAAHANGIKLHAWLNTAPIWRDSSAPNDAGHPFFNVNPSFRRTDLNGNLESPLAPNGEYASANFILPEVHTHISNVVNDIATNYDVDGVHLDYIRWLGSQTFDTLPHDAQSHQLFNQATGLDPTNAGNAAAYQNYIKGRVTDLVSSVKSRVDLAEVSTGRKIELSAAVWRDPEIAENERLQDYRTWLESDLLDIAMPMIYLSSSNDELYVPNLTNTLNIKTSTRIAPAVGTFLHNSGTGGVDLTVAQLRRTQDFGADGSTFFSYNDFFNDPLAVSRRQTVTAYFNSGGSSYATPEQVNFIADFENDESYFGWPVTFSGSNSGVGASSTADQVTDESFAGDGSQRVVIDCSPSGWFLRHLSGIGSAADTAGNLTLDATGFVGFWLKTDDPGMSVQIAIDDPHPAIERGVEQAVVADGSWHLYQWNLEDAGQWEAWVGGADGGITSNTVTLDSIQLRGAGDATFYIDSISYNPDGPLLAPMGDYNGDYLVDGDDLLHWQAGFALADNAAGIEDGDSNGDGEVDGRDFLNWQRKFGHGAAAPIASSQSIPEPVSSVLLLLALSAMGSCRCKQ